MAKRKFIPGLVLFILGAALVAGLIVKLDGQNFIDSLLRVSPKAFFAIFGLTLVAHVLANIRAVVLLRFQGVDISFWKIFMITLAGNSFNYTTPFVFLGGEGIKAYLLKEKHDVPWKTSTSFLVFDRMLEITAAFFVVVVALIVFIVYSGLPGLTKTLLSLAMGIALVAGLIFLVYFQMFRNKKMADPVLKAFSIQNTRIGKFLRKAEKDVMMFFDLGSKAMWYSWGLSILKQIVFLLRHIYLIYFLTGGFHFIASVIALGMLYLGFLIPVPGALGVQEAFQGLSLAVFGFTASQGFALSVVLRGVDILIVFAGFGIMLHYGLSLIAVSAKHVLQFNNDTSNKESSDDEKKA